ncbi:MAG: S8 family serine peptidase [Acidobacteriia bacterium]|nr:S8 family serine peptidase [Terriglobia bacterium]
MKRLALLALLTSTLGFGQISKIAPDLLNLLKGLTQPVDVVIQYNNTPGLLELGKLLTLGGLIKTQYNLIPAVSATLPSAVVAVLALDPNVAYISPDRELKGTVDLTTATSNADQAIQSGWTGAGIGIAIVDSGIYAHPDLAGRIVYSQSFVRKTNADDYGHGTHVAGIAAGSGASSTGPHFTQSFRGVAPGASLIDLRVLDANGMSSDSVVIAAIDRAMALKSKFNIRVINLSLGRPIHESASLDPICAAVAAAWKNGIVVVVAAGNLGRNGYGTILSPGNSPYAITVGAMKSEGTPNRGDDLIASYSSKGPTWIDFEAKPDIVAAGNLVGSLLAPGSTLAKEYPGNVIPASAYILPGYSAAPEYFTLSGTSMATPVVSGAAAILIQAEPSLTPDTIKARLMKTASKTFPLTSIAVDSTTGQVYPSTYDMFTIGAGYLDIYAALNNRDTGRGVALSPIAVWNPVLSTALLFKSASSLWDNGTWSLLNVWGTHSIHPLINGTSAAWGDGGIWGSSAAWGDSTKWGTSAAWGDSTGWGSSAAWGDSLSANGEK